MLGLNILISQIMAFGSKVIKIPFLQHVMFLRVVKAKVKIVLVKVHKVQLQMCCHEI